MTAPNSSEGSPAAKSERVQADKRTNAQQTIGNAHKRSSATYLGPQTPFNNSGSRRRRGQASAREFPERADTQSQLTHGDPRALAGEEGHEGKMQSTASADSETNVTPPMRGMPTRKNSSAYLGPQTPFNSDSERMRRINESLDNAAKYPGSPSAKHENFRRGYQTSTILGGVGGNRGGQSAMRSSEEPSMAEMSVKNSITGAEKSTISPARREPPISPLSNPPEGPGTPRKHHQSNAKASPAAKQGKRRMDKTYHSTLPTGSWRQGEQRNLPSRPPNADTSMRNPYYNIGPRTKEYGVLFSQQTPGTIFRHLDDWYLIEDPDYDLASDLDIVYDAEDKPWKQKLRHFIVTGRDEEKDTVDEVAIYTNGNKGLAGKSDHVKWQYVSVKPKEVKEEFENQVPGRPVLSVGWAKGTEELSRVTMVANVANVRTRKMDCDELQKVGGLDKESEEALVQLVGRGY